MAEISESLKQGACGDNVAMQAVSDMLSVTIHVLYPMYSVTPQNQCATDEAFVGLIMHYHYVGLEKNLNCPNPLLISQTSQNIQNQPPLMTS